MQTFRARLALLTALTAPVGLVALSCGQSRPSAGPTDLAARRAAFVAKGLTAPGACVLRGSVMYDGRPVTVGRLLFYYPPGPVPVAARIRPDGSFVATGLPVGKARVSVVLDPGGGIPFVRSGPAGPKGKATAKPKPGPTPVSPGVLAVGPNPTARPASPRPFSPIRVPLLPETVVRDLENFQVPKANLAEYRRLHKKYASPYTPDAPAVDVKPGTTVFDIVLK